MQPIISTPMEEPVAAAIMCGERRTLRRLLASAALTLIALVVAGVVVERSARTPIVAIGQPAHPFTLPATQGGTVSLAAQRGHPVVLAFVPSVQCGFCQTQLRALEEALPTLRTRGVRVMVVSTDTSLVQQGVATRLKLNYPLLSEAPTVNQHPVGSAYGIYHISQGHPGPVDANALVIIDATGIVRAVEVQAGQAVPADTILTLVARSIGIQGGSP